MKIPSIDFKYWFAKNQKDSLNENRFIRLITKIQNIYIKNNEYNQTYFCGDELEIRRLKNHNYISFENEIINNIRSLKSFDDYSEVLKIFDLIQIWGGLQGGSNFYNIVNGSSLRMDYDKWIKKYIELIKYSISRDKKAYQIVYNGEIENLRMSFGSKHISFWSRQNSDLDCFVIIDNKIAGLSGAKTALESDYNDILFQIKEYAEQNQIKNYEIEKALFTFHKSYFNNSNTFYFAENNNVDNKDIEAANQVFKNLNLNSDNQLLNTKGDTKKSESKKSKNKLIKLVSGKDYGILASVDWNSNNWSAIPTSEDIANSHYDFVKKNRFSYTFLNFGHLLYPTDLAGFYQGCLPCFFSKNVNSDRKKTIRVIFIYSKNWQDKHKYIIGLYAFPIFEKGTKKSPVPNFDKEIVVNIRSYIDDIHILQNRLILSNPLPEYILPNKTKLSKQSFNYLNKENVLYILDEISKINKSDNYLLSLSDRIRNELY